MVSKSNFKKNKVLWLLSVSILLSVSRCTHSSNSDPSPVPASNSTACSGSGIQLGSPSSTWTRFSNNPILLPGSILSPFSQHSINVADPSIMYDPTENLWKMWFANAFDQNDNYASTPNSRVGLSYAISSDGIQWCMDSQAVLMPTVLTGGPSSDWDYTNIETPTVIKNPDASAPADRKYMMWYAGGNKLAGTLSSGHPFYQIGLAFSGDGKTFTRVPASESPYGIQGLVLKSVDTVPGYTYPGRGVASDPHVIYRGGVFQMWFSNITYTDSNGTTLQTAGISYASSTNGKSWTPYSGNPLTSLWRSGVAVGWQPTVLWNSNSNLYEMWFTADTTSETNSLSCSSAGALGFFKATSADGITWTPNFSQRDFAGDNSRLEESCNLITGVEAVLKDGHYYLYYSSYGTKNIPSLLSSVGYPVVWSLSLSYK